MNNMKMKWLIVIGVTALSIWLFWPPKEKLNFGLDLKGGTHLTLQVDVSKINRKDVPMVVEGTLKVLRNRIDSMGIKEASITLSGEDRIIIQIPDVTDTKAARQMVGQTALLEFCLVSENQEDISKAKSGEEVPGYRLVNFAKSETEEAEPEGELLIKTEPDVTGKYLIKARAVMGGNFSEPMVSIEFNKEGGKIFAMVTKENKGQRLAIVLDGRILSAPVIKDIIPDGKATISGRMNINRANELAVLLNSGALPTGVEVISEMTVSPTLGADSIKKGVTASIYGLILVLAFMAVYYLLSGMVANFAVVFNIVLLLGFLAFFKATITLPGIAGIILSLAMAVDANVLIYERIREELASGKKIKSAITYGYNKAFSAILDSNLTTILTALILYFVGTGSVKGFGLTLTAGIAISMFTALVITRMVFDLLTDNLHVQNLKMFHFFGEPKFDFVKMRKYTYLITVVLIVIGMTVFFARGKNNLGIDFKGGTVLQIKFDKPVEIENLRDILEKKGLGKAVIQYTGTEKKDILIKTDSKYELIQDAFKTSLTGSTFTTEGVSEIGPAVSKDLSKKAIWAIILSWLGILVYVAWRFEFDYAFGAVFALVHDVFITTGAMSIYCYFTGREFDLTVIAAILTMIGYSINDTIVVFDRIRERNKLVRNEPFGVTMNISINQTLSRTILTSLTVLLALIALYFFGGVVLKGFSFTLLVGVITGTYSSIFVASALVYDWRRITSVKKA